MKLVVEIPDNEYSNVLKGRWEGNPLADYIENGKLLPKGHGRLIDADKLEMRDISPESWYSPMWGLQISDIEDAPTIIEADRE